ncbi:MAG TPA: EamA family transporter [Desulfobaccales bacterium]|nr:EamA family transporter [Desulfobaccales bacterium]
MKDLSLARLGEDMNWLGFSLLALGLWGVWGFLDKVATQHLPPQIVYLLTISGHLVVVAYLLAGGLGPVTWRAGGVGAALGAGIAMAVALLFFLEALATAPASIVVPFTALYPAVTVILCWIFLQEALTLRHLTGLGLALAAVWLLSN